VERLSQLLDSWRPKVTLPNEDASKKDKTKEVNQLLDTLIAFLSYSHWFSYTVNFPATRCSLLLSHARED
jgi:hypothetical protein